MNAGVYILGGYERVAIPTIINTSQYSPPDPLKRVETIYTHTQEYVQALI